MCTPTNHDSSLQAITSIINKAVPANALFCFGRRSSVPFRSSALLPSSIVSQEKMHYDLLLVTDSETRTLCTDIMNLVNVQMKGACEITLLMHRLTELCPQNVNMQHFFWHVLQSGEALSQQFANPPYTVSERPVRDYGKSERYWNERYFLAKTLLDTEKAVTGAYSGLIKCSMLNQAVCLICLGLIEVFLGYRPNYCSRKFLFQLCGHFSALPKDVFPIALHEDQKVLQLLDINPGHLRHRATMSVDARLLTILEYRCNQFLTEATIMAEVHLMPYLSNTKN